MKKLAIGIFLIILGMVCLGLCLLVILQDSNYIGYIFLEIGVICLGTGIYMIMKLRGKVKDD